MAASEAEVQAAAGLEEDAKREALERVNDAIRDAIRAEEAFQATLTQTAAAEATTVAATEAVTTAATGLLSLTERLTAGLASGIGVQVDWTEELKKALGPTSSIAEELRGPYVEGLLKAKQATEDLAKISQIRDTSIAAQAIALQDAAAKENDVTRAQEKQAAATAFVLAAIDAQTRGHAAAAAQATALVKPLDDLAKSIYPALTAQQIAQVESLQKTEGSYAALAAAAAAAGIDVGKFGDLTQLTGQQFAAVKAEVDAAAKGFASFLDDETKSRIGSGLLGLASGIDAVTAAQVKQAQASGNTKQALDLLAGGLGVHTGLVRTWAAELEAGGKAAFAAKEQIAALTTYARNASGQIDLKINVDSEKVQTQIQDINRSSQRAAEDMRLQVDSLIHSVGQSTLAYDKSIADIQQTQVEALQAISVSRSQSASELGSDLAKVVGSQNSALASVATAERAAQTTFNDARLDAATQRDLAFANAAKTYQDGIKGLQDQTNQAIQTAAQAAASGLQTLSAAMTTFNQQQVQNQFTASVALQNAQNAANGFTDTQSVASATRSAQIQAEGAAGIAQQNQVTALAQAQNSVAQQQLDATKALSKSMDDLAKQTKALADAQKTAQLTATTQKENADVAAQKALTISQQGADYYNATHTQTQAIVIGPDGVPRVVTGTAATSPGTAALDELGIQRGGTAGSRQGIDASTKTQLDAAEARFAQRTKQLNEQEAAARKRAEDQLAELKHTREEQLRQFLLQAEALVRQERRRAEDEERQKKALNVQQDTLDQLKRMSDHLPADTAEAMMARINAQPQEFNFNNQTVIETQVDFAAASTAEIARRVRSKT